MHWCGKHVNNPRQLQSLTGRRVSYVDPAGLRVKQHGVCKCKTPMHLRTYCRAAALAETGRDGEAEAARDTGRRRAGMARQRRLGIRGGDGMARRRRVRRAVVPQRLRHCCGRSGAPVHLRIRKASGYPHRISFLMPGKSDSAQAAAPWLGVLAAGSHTAPHATLLRLCSAGESCIGRSCLYSPLPGGPHCRPGAALPTALAAQGWHGQDHRAA